MNWLDILILAGLVALGIMGWRSGINRATISLVGAAIGIHLATLYNRGLAKAFSPLIANENTGRLVAAAVVFVVAFAIVYILGMKLKEMLQGQEVLDWLDNMAGLLFVLLLGSAAIGAFVLVLRAYPVLGLGEAVGGSALSPYVAGSYKALVGFLPGDLSQIGGLLPKG